MVLSGGGKVGVVWECARPSRGGYMRKGVGWKVGGGGGARVQVNAMLIELNKSFIFFNL